MTGDRMRDGNNRIMETSPDDAKPQGFFRSLLRGTRFWRNGDSSLRETFEELIEQHEENEPPVDPVARAMLDKVLTVGALTVSDVMVPRADITAVDVSIERNEILKLLVEEFAFPKTNIVTLYDDQATKENIIRELDNLTDNQKVRPEDQVLVFFSGHGQTIKTPIGGDVGYLVPADASVTLKDNSNPGDYVKKCIPMDKLKQASGLSQAKHLLFLVDACYSGLAAGAKGSRSEQPLDKLKDLRAHDIITAGLKSEIVKENPKWGHGAFTYKLLGALKEKLSDANQDSLTTGSELSTYLKNSVPEIANQNPQYARFSGEGEFVFEHQDPVSLDKQSPRLYFVQSQSEGKSKGFKRKRKNQGREGEAKITRWC